MVVGLLQHLFQRLPDQPEAETISSPQQLRLALLRRRLETLQTDSDIPTLRGSMGLCLTMLSKTSPENLESIVKTLCHELRELEAVIDQYEPGAGLYLEPDHTAPQLEIADMRERR